MVKIKIQEVYWPLPQSSRGLLTFFPKNLSKIVCDFRENNRKINGEIIFKWENKNRKCIDKCI